MLAGSIHYARKRISWARHLDYISRRDLGTHVARFLEMQPLQGERARECGGLHLRRTITDAVAGGGGGGGGRPRGSVAPRCGWHPASRQRALAVYVARLLLSWGGEDGRERLDWLEPDRIEPAVIIRMLSLINSPRGSVGSIQSDRVCTCAEDAIHS